MQKCEIMLNDLIDSRRTNTNVKATITQPSQTGSNLIYNIFFSPMGCSWDSYCHCQQKTIVCHTTVGYLRRC